MLGCFCDISSLQYRDISKSETMGKSARNQQYSSIRIHHTISRQIRRIRCLYTLALVSTGVAVAFVVLYAVKEQQSSRRKECLQSNCVQVAAGEINYSIFSINFFRDNFAWHSQ